MALLETKNLTKTYFDVGAPIEVLRGVNLNMPQGDMLAVVGESGAGKSTLLYVIGGLEHPTSGQVYFDDRLVNGSADNDSTLPHGKTDTTSEPAPARPRPYKTDAALSAFRNRSIGFVFQFHGLIPEFDSLENTMMPALIAGLDRKAAADRATEKLEKLGLGDRLAHKPGELSGGEQQRVAFARALVMEPQLILADEPTGNLDIATGEKLWDLMFKINEIWQASFIVVTHNERLAGRLPRVCRLTDGRLEEAS